MSLVFFNGTTECETGIVVESAAIEFGESFAWKNGKGV